MRALILIDIQNDFCPGGALAVRDGDAVAPIANALMQSMAANDLVVATQDWHPADHASFASNHPGRKPYEVIDIDGLAQVLWPAHCVQGTPGANLLSNLQDKRIDRVFRKGTDRGIDSYSGFFDNGRRKATGLGEFLRERGVDAITVCGLATDYCVKATVLDARGLGFAVTVVTDGCRAVEVAPGDGAAAFAAMAKAGARLAASRELLEQRRSAP